MCDQPGDERGGGITGILNHDFVQCHTSPFVLRSAWTCDQTVSVERTHSRPNFGLVLTKSLSDSHTYQKTRYSFRPSGNLTTWWLTLKYSMMSVNSKYWPTFWVENIWATLTIWYWYALPVHFLSLCLLWLCLVLQQIGARNDSFDKSVEWD